ncbi:MAG: O-antigen ligase family protein [Candidatus Acidiferrales bacterium]|jgi:O-antigen ligase
MKAIRIGICALVVFAVAAHGAVEAWASAVIETGAAALLVVWAVSAFWRKGPLLRVPPLLPALAAFVGVAALQLAVRLTASPFDTRIELLRLSAWLILVFLAGQAYQTLEDWRGFIWFLMVLGFVVSVFGILQHLTFNGKLYWLREMRYGGIPFGPYVNRNHFAGFAELVIPAGLVPLVLGKVRRDRWMLVALFCLLPIGALFMSASRGGIVSLLVELALIGVMAWVRRGKRAPLLAGGLVLLLAGGFVAWLGVGRALERFSSLEALEVTHNKRVSMAKDTWHIFLDHPLLGTGLGTLQTVFPKYETLYDGKIVNHAHNDYLEVLADTGIAGGLCCTWFLIVLVKRAVHDMRQPGNTLGAVMNMAGLVACGGILAHSFVDFNLHIPSNALLFLLSATLATASVASRNRRGPAVHPKVATVGIPD